MQNTIIILNFYIQSDIKPSCGPPVIDLTSEGAFTAMSHQPLRHMPAYPTHAHHSSAFHRVSNPPESHG